MGKLGVLIPGVGAVATTFIAGVLKSRLTGETPIGSITQMGRFESTGQQLAEILPIAGLDEIEFAGWDPMSDDALKAAEHAAVLSEKDIALVADGLRQVTMFPAVFDTKWVDALDPIHVHTAESKWELAQQVKADIDSFAASSGCDRFAMIWCGSTEAYSEPAACHKDVASFEQGLRDSDPAISPSQIYAYAALSLGIPFANGAPNLTLDLPCMEQLAAETTTPFAGKDFKTGQTFMKTVLAPALKARMLKLDGWYSTNILGNRDGLVLDSPQNFKTKEASKLGVLDSILDADDYPELYDDMDHVVRINYYPPRGDQKEGWDNIDISGWMGYDMQIKVNFLCRDSILAAPLALDLVLLLDLAKQNGQSGVQDWLGFYFKAPQEIDGGRVEHDLFLQRQSLISTAMQWAKDPLGT